jgi:hypothetical protein
VSAQLHQRDAPHVGDRRQAQVLETLRPLREGGLLHGQLDQLWGLATEARQRFDDHG